MYEESNDQSKNLSPSALEEQQIERAKQIFGSRIEKNYQVPIVVAETLGSGLEAGSYRREQGKGYTLEDERITIPYNSQDPVIYYKLSPAKDTTSPELVIYSKGQQSSIYLNKDGKMVNAAALNSLTNGQTFRDLLDAYEQVVQQGVTVGSNVSHTVSLEEVNSLVTLDRFIAAHPQAVEDFGREQFDQKRAELVAKAEQEKQKKIEWQQRLEEVARQREAEVTRKKERRREQEGHNLSEGVRIYALQKEAETTPENGLYASLVNSARALIWRREGEQVEEGPLLQKRGNTNPSRRLLNRLTESDDEFSDAYPREILEQVERSLTQEFVSIETSAQTGKSVLRIPRVESPGAFARNGPYSSPDAKASSLYTRGHTVSTAENGDIVISPDENTTFIKYEIAIAPDMPVSAQLLDKNGQPTGRNVVTSPLIQGNLTEQVQQGETTTEEKTTFFRALEGSIIKCPGQPAVCYPQDLAPHIEVARKPVIYLYPPTPIDVKVVLNYKGQLTNTYPQITNDTWQIKAFPDGTIETNKKKYKYLFWDGINSEIDWNWSEGFSVHKSDMDSFLEKKIEALGLNFAEAQDFITYWAPMLKQNEWSLISFQTEKYEELAKLTINPKPDTLIRVFMIFKKIDKKLDIPEQTLRTLKRKGFTVIEWGGSNLDEIHIEKQERQIRITHTSLAPINVN